MTDPPIEATPERGRSWLGRGVTMLAVGAPLGVWLWGQMWRDETWLTGLCYYLPSPVLAVWFFGVAAWLFSIRHPKAAICVLCLSIAPLVVVVGSENQWSSPAPAANALESRPSLKLVHWNVKRGDRSWELIVDRLLEFDADAYFLSETPHSGNYEEFVGYDIVQWFGMTVLVRGELSFGKELHRDHRMLACTLEWESEQGPIRLLMADISAFLHLHRDPKLRQLNGFIAAEKPDLVVGDLNAPRGSRELSPPTAGYRHAYEAAGAGWSYTWPVPIPVYAIDHLLIGKRVVPIRYDLVTTRLSDHRMQVFEFLFDR